MRNRASLPWPPLVLAGAADLMAYESTTVDVPKSQADIRKVLRSAGADRITFAEQITGPAKSAGVEFRPLAEPDGKAVAAKADRSRSKSRDEVFDEMVEQEARRIWRVLHWGLKARMESVAEGLETFEQAFLPHLVDPSTNRTLWDTVRGSIEGGALQQADGNGLGSMLAPGSGR